MINPTIVSADKIPNVQLSPSDRVLQWTVNTNLTLSCSFDGSPTPKVVWQKDGQDILGTTCPKSSPCQLFLQHVQFKKDGGEYTCVARHYLKDVTASTTVEVQGNHLSVTIFREVGDLTLML